jgi:hypothetical protein
MAVPIPPAVEADPTDALLPPALRADLLADVNEATDPRSLANLVCRALAGAAGCDAAWCVARRDDRRPAPDVTASAGLAIESAADALRSPLTARALAVGEPQSFGDAAVAGLQHVALAPFHGCDGAALVLGIGRGPDGEPFDARDVEALGALARSAGHALERLWLT